MEELNLSIPGLSEDLGTQRRCLWAPDSSTGAVKTEKKVHYTDLLARTAPNFHCVHFVYCCNSTTTSSLDFGK